MSTLFDLIGLVSILEARLFEAGGEITPELESSFEMTDIQLKNKIDTYGLVCEGMTRRKEYALSRLREWEAVVNRCEKAEETLKERLKAALTVMDKEEVHGYEFTVRLQTNPPKVKIVDENLIPGEFITTTMTTSVNKREILEKLKNGLNVAGADIERTQRVVIKTSQRKLRE